MDNDVHLLRPENVDGGGGGGDTGMGEGEQGQGQGQQQPQRRSSVGIGKLVDGARDPSEGEELDRAFGGMGLQ